MIVYLVVSPLASAPPALESAITVQFKDNHCRIGPNSWLVAASKKTARQISDELGVTDGKNGSAIVSAVGDYFGRLNRDVWAWIKLKLESEA